MARAKQSEEEVRRTLKADFDERLSLELREQRLKYESKLNVGRFAEPDNRIVLCSCSMLQWLLPL